MLAPEHVRNYLDGFESFMIEEVTASEEALNLADLYVAEKVVGATSLADCQHIAIATIHRVDVLVSWNFKHIVNLRRRDSIESCGNGQMKKVAYPCF